MSRTKMKPLVLLLFLMCCFLQVFGMDDFSDDKASSSEIDLNLSDDEFGKPKKYSKLEEIKNEETLPPAQTNSNYQSNEAKEFDANEYTDVNEKKSKRNDANYFINHKNEQYNPNYAALRFWQHKVVNYDVVTEKKESFIKQKQTKKFEEDFPSTSKFQNLLKSKNNTLYLEADKITIFDEVKKELKRKKYKETNNPIQSYIYSSDDESNTNKLLREGYKKTPKFEEKRKNEILMKKNKETQHNFGFQSSKYTIKEKTSTSSLLTNPEENTKTRFKSIKSNAEDEIIFEQKKKEDKIQEEDSEMKTNYSPSSIASFSEYDYNELCPLLCYICGRASNNESVFLLCDWNPNEEHGAHMYCAGFTEVPKDDWYCDQHLQNNTDIKSKNEKENIEEEEKEETEADNDIEFLINMMNCQNQTQTEGQESEKIVKIEIISDENDIDPKSFDIKKRIQDIDVEFQKIQIKEIQICEYKHCKQKISGSNGHLTKGPVSGIRLCGPCYKYESRHNCLIPRSERLKGPVRLESNRLINPICEYCTQTAKWFTKGPVSSMKLCNACYKYEMKYRCLIPRSERLKGPNKNSKIKSKEKDDNFNMKENDVSDFVNDSDTEVEYIENSEKYPGIYKNIRKNFWFSFGYVGDTKMVLAMDQEELDCKRKTDERIKLEKETNNLEVVPFNRCLKKNGHAFSKENISAEKQEETKLIHVKFDDADEQNNSLLECPCCVPNKENLVYHIHHFGMNKEVNKNRYIFRSKIYEYDHEKYMARSRNYNKAVKKMQQKNQECINQYEPVDPLVGETFEDIQKSEYVGVYYNQRINFWYLVGYVNGEKVVLVQEKTESDCLSKGIQCLEVLKASGHEVKLCDNLIDEYTNIIKTMENERKETIDVELTDQLDEKPAEFDGSLNSKK